MRKIDKKINLIKANLLAEQRHLDDKGFISEKIEVLPTPELDKLIIVKTAEKYILVNKDSNLIEADIFTIDKFIDNNQLCNVAMRVYDDAINMDNLYENNSDKYKGGGTILGPLSACNKNK